MLRDVGDYVAIGGWVQQCAVGEILTIAAIVAKRSVDVKMGFRAGEMPSVGAPDCPGSPARAFIMGSRGDPGGREGTIMFVTLGRPWRGTGGAYSCRNCSLEVSIPVGRTR